MVKFSGKKFGEHFRELRKKTEFTDSTIADYLQWLFKTRDFTVKGLKRKLDERRLENIKSVNSFFDQDLAKLGPDLHSATYAVRLGGRFRLQDSSRWIGLDDQSQKLSDILPEERSVKFKVEGLDLSKTVIQTSGLTNFEYCSNLRTMILRDCYFVDDWFTTEISRTFADRLESLDLTGCQKLNDSGLWNLGYLSKLKELGLGNICATNKEYIAVLLEDEIRGLEINGLDIFAEDTLKSYEERVIKKKVDNANHQ